MIIKLEIDTPNQNTNVKAIEAILLEACNEFHKQFTHASRGDASFVFTTEFRDKCKLEVTK